MSTENNKDFIWTDSLVKEFHQWYAENKGKFEDHLREFKFQKLNGEERSPEYEVLSYRSKLTDLIISVAAHQPDQPISPLYAIHSARRLSDGEVFTLGDTVYHVDGLYPVTITEFYQPPSDRGEMWFYWSSFKETVKNLDNFKKQDSLISPPKKPLFTTEDGVDIYEETVTLHGINTETWIPGRLHFSRIFQDPEWKWFAIPYNRDRYILMNKPTLSVNEVLDIFRDHEVFDELVSELHERAKAKL